MTAKQSNLTSPKYGYDFVVATTQASINATMKEYLSGISNPEIVMCYVMDEKGAPQRIDHDELLTRTDGVDPFDVFLKNGEEPSKNPLLKKLAGAYFWYGFKAQMGLPPDVTIPDIVTLGSNTASVGYNLMCSSFTVVQATYGPMGILSWLNRSQLDDIDLDHIDGKKKPGLFSMVDSMVDYVFDLDRIDGKKKPWLFTSQVDLRLTTVEESHYKNLSPHVQEQIKNKGSQAFSVQQLLFDLDNAALQSVPQIAGVKPGTPLYASLQTVFLGAYFEAMKEKGSPILATAITEQQPDRSTLKLTDLNFNVNPFVDSNGRPVQEATPEQKDLSTLNYLCAANGHALPDAAKFPWNWIEPAEKRDFHGVVVINRNTFANYFKEQLQKYVQSNCYRPEVTISLDGWSQPRYHFNAVGCQTPTIEIPVTGAEVLRFSYSATAEDEAGAGGNLAEARLTPSFNLSVSFAGNCITVQQHLVFDLYFRRMQTSAKGNIVDKTITETYTLAVTQDGVLECKKDAPHIDDKRKDLEVNAFESFFTAFNSMSDAIEAWANNVAERTFTPDAPLRAAQSFIFPGGKTFAFKDVVFSDYQDLIAHITYAQAHG